MPRGVRARLQTHNQIQPQSITLTAGGKLPME